MTHIFSKKMVGGFRYTITKEDESTYLSEDTRTQLTKIDSNIKLHIPNVYK